MHYKVKILSPEVYFKWVTDFNIGLVFLYESVFMTQYSSGLIHTKKNGNSSYCCNKPDQNGTYSWKIIAFLPK